MRRSFAILVLSLILVAFGGPASAGPKDSVQGNHRVEQPTGDFQDVNVNAKSGPLGENPKGHAHVSFQSPFFPGGSGDLKGTVTCLRVTGTQARVAALLKQPHQGNTHVTLIINDNGDPMGGVSPDNAFIGFTSAPPANCAGGGLELAGDKKGNLRVEDAI